VLCRVVSNIRYINVNGARIMHFLVKPNQMSSGQTNVFIVQRLYRQISSGQMLYGETSYGETSYGQMSLGKRRMGKRRMGKCLWANVVWANVIGPPKIANALCSSLLLLDRAAANIICTHPPPHTHIATATQLHSLTHRIVDTVDSS
jgi:hypothetical protein